MIRIASETGGKAKGRARATPVEDAQTWPTNKAPSKRKRSRLVAEKAEASRTSSKDRAQADVRTMPAYFGQQGEGRKIPGAPSPKPLGTDNEKESKADTVQAALDVTLLTSRYALLALASAIAGDANCPANAVPVSTRRKPANGRSVSKRKGKPRKKGQAATTALQTAEAGQEGDGADSATGAIIARKALSPSRLAYQRDLMRRRRAAERVAKVIV